MVSLSNFGNKHLIIIHIKIFIYINLLKKHKKCNPTYLIRLHTFFTNYNNINKSISKIYLKIIS